MIYIFIGPPASGKGTQAKLLAQELMCPFFSIGALLREKAEHDAGLKDLISRGEMADETLVADMVADLSLESNQNVVVDGIIRNPMQADLILKYWKPSDVTVIVIELDDQTCIERAMQRAQESSHRADDVLDVVKNRLKIYRSTENENLEHIKNNHYRCIKINGAGSVETIYHVIMEALHDNSA